LGDVSNLDIKHNGVKRAIYFKFETFVPLGKSIFVDDLGRCNLLAVEKDMHKWILVLYASNQL